MRLVAPAESAGRKFQDPTALALDAPDGEQTGRSAAFRETSYTILRGCGREIFSKVFAGNGHVKALTAHDCN